MNGKGINGMNGITLDLHMFGLDGASAGDGAGAPDGTGAEGAQTDEATEATEQGGEKAAQKAKPAQSESERMAAFEKMIAKGGEYHDLYRARTQKMIDTRFASTKKAEEAMAGVTPILEIVAQRYGLDPKDHQGIMAALDRDTVGLEAEAAEKGISVEALRQIKTMERENLRYKRSLEEEAQKREVNERLENWRRQAEQAKAQFPMLDLHEELTDPETGPAFYNLLKANVDVGAAFRVVHQDEILSGAITMAAQQAQQRTLDNIRARGRRPAENGASGNGAATSGIKGDPTQWSKEDFAKIDKMLRTGQTVEL